MRIRSTKPEFWRSERIAVLSWDARLVLKGLESYVDDNGVGKDDVALIVADVFPRDMLANPRETVARVSESISELHRHGFIHRYESEGTRLLYVSWWEEVQRIDKPGKGRFPRPDGTMNYRDSVIRESVASPRESVAPGTGEQGNRGSVEETCSPALPLNVIAHPTATSRRTSSQGEPTGFSDFWSVYPRRQNKGAAVKAFAKAIKKADLAEIVAGARRYADDPNRDPAFTAHASTWLNGERWTDDPTPHRAAASSAAARSQAIQDMTAQLIQQRRQENR